MSCEEAPPLLQSDWSPESDTCSNFELFKPLEQRFLAFVLCLLTVSKGHGQKKVAKQNPPPATEKKEIPI